MNSSEKKKNSKNEMREDAPVNVVGGGNIAGLGVGPQGEPGINKKKKFLPFKQFFKRKAMQ
jgi:hypothetical protein